MHEYGLMEAVVGHALETCRGKDGLTPVRVRVQVGEFAFASRESLETAFEILTRGTSLEGARLDLERLPGRARCESCGFTGTAADLGQDVDERPVPLICPDCGLPLLVMEGAGLVLADVQLEDRGRPPHPNPSSGGR